TLPETWYSRRALQRPSFQAKADQRWRKIMSENTPVTIRGISPQDVEPCGRAAYAAHTAVAAAHNVPCEHPSAEFLLGLVCEKTQKQKKHGVVAVCVGGRAGNPFGSVFFNIFPGTPAAAIGPLTVDPKGEGAGRWLMQAAIEE